MSNSFSKFTMVGRLTKDPVLKELEDGKKVCNITLAVDRPYKDKEGNQKTDFFPLALWNKQAENICEISKQGSLICLEGHNTMKNVGTEKEPAYEFSPVVTSYRHLSHKKEVANEVEEQEKTEDKVK